MNVKLLKVYLKIVWYYTYMVYIMALTVDDNYTEYCSCNLYGI
jgi:hypothetical protein